MAIAFFRIFEVKTPLLPVVVSAVVSSDRNPSASRVWPVSCAQAAADRMPPSVGDYVLDHTEAAHPLPVVVPICLVGSR